MTGTDHQIWAKAPVTAPAWVPLGGVTGYAPAAVRVGGAAGLLFLTGDDLSLTVRDCTGTGCGPPRSLGGHLVGTVGVAADAAGGITVVALGLYDRTLYQLTLTAAGPSPWTKGWTPTG